MRTDVASATRPARASPPSGPTVYDSISIPARRPRCESGIVWCQIVARNSPLIMSNAPASTSPSSTSAGTVVSPASTTDAPHAAAASTTARPWWCTRAVHPLVAVARSEPTVPAEYSSPSSAGCASTSAASAGNSTTGMARNIATRSTTYVPSRSGRRAA